MDDSIDAEIIANRFAGEFLMPESQLLPFYNSSRAVDKIDSSARHFRVSKLSMALRLKGSGVIFQEQVDAVVDEFDQTRSRERDERENEMDVSYFLNAHIPMVEQIKDKYYRRISS